MTESARSDRTSALKKVVIQLSGEHHLLLGLGHPRLAAIDASFEIGYTKVLTLLIPVYVFPA